MTDHLPEARVTSILSRLLATWGWYVVAIHYPGSQSGMYFHSSKRTGKGAKGSMVPDIVARHNSSILFVESKSIFVKKDVDKLVRLTEAQEYKDEIKSKLHLNDNVTYFLIRGIAVNRINLAKENFPPDFIVFLVAPTGVRTYGTLSNFVRLAGLIRGYSKI